MRNHTLPIPCRTPSAIAALALLFCASAANATDSYAPATRQLTIPSLTVGAATFSNVVVVIGAIVSGPAGSGPNGSADSYDPVNGNLTVPAVTVGASTFFNVVATVQDLVSIGSVSGADRFRAGYLAAASVLDGSTTYDNVIVPATTANIVSVGSGMPARVQDVFDPVAGLLSIPAIQAGSAVYTNVTLRVSSADVISTGPFKTLAQVQADIFTPHCARCHNGVGSFLPGVQNLSNAAATQANLVGVHSIEKPAMLRANPGDPNSSYVIMKLEGAAGIVGVRMPEGGPYLTSAQIAEVKSWIVGLSPP